MRTTPVTEFRAARRPGPDTRIPMPTNIPWCTGLGLALLLCWTLSQAAPAVPSATRAGDWLPGQILVKWKPAVAGPAGAAVATAATTALQLPGVRVKTTMPVLGWQWLLLPPGMDVRVALDYYRNLPGVAFAEPNYRVRLFATPNDPLAGSLWGLEKIQAQAAWDQFTGDPGVVVATLDTGIDYDHADLAANMWTNPGEIPGNNIDDDGNGYVDDVHGINTFNNSGDVRDDDGHGTHVAGTIGAVGNNGVGVTGVNWRVKLVSVKIFTADDSSGSAGAVAGYDYLIALKRSGVNLRVVNNSWGGPVPSQALYEAMCAAEAEGILTVCAAGNSNRDADERPEFPASLDCPSLISVAASTQDDDVATFSNYGAFMVDLAAPGESVLSTYHGAGHYQRLSGTSMASPHVAGAAALLLGKDPSLSPAMVKALLLATVDPLPQWQGRVRSGGRLNLGNAMARLISGPLPVPGPETNEPARPWPRIAAISRNAQGRWGSASSYWPALTTNGQFVAYLSLATNLVPGAAGSHIAVYLHDRLARTTVHASHATNGGPPNGDCDGARISGDGRFVVFSSAASNLVSGDGNGASDVFLYDRNSGLVELVSRNAAGSGPGNGASDTPAVSSDGRYVVFASDASNLVSGDTNGRRDIFLRDRQFSTTVRVSVSSGGAQADYTSDLPAISGDGRYITFISGADNLVPDPYIPAYHLYLRDRVAGTTERISRNAQGQPGNDNCGYSSLSADGRYIAFEADADNLVPGDSNGVKDIYLWDRVTRALARISAGNDGAQADADCWVPGVSADGRHVCFFSNANTLCAQDDDSNYDIFDYDRWTGKLSRLSYNAAGHTGLDSSFLPSPSADGRFVVFDAWAWNLATGDGNGSRDVFVVDRGDSIPDLMISAAGDVVPAGIGLHGTNIVQRRELPATNGPAVFVIRLDNDGPSDDSFIVRASASPPGWDGRFMAGSIDVTAALTGPGWPVSVPAAGNVVLQLTVTSTNAAVGASWAEWVVLANGIRPESGLDAVRAVATRLPSPPALLVLSRAADGRPGNHDSGPANLSGDGRFITFTSTASDLVGRDYNLQEDVFVVDRDTRAIECLSRTPDGTNGNARSYSPRISRDGRYVVFQSLASDLVPGDTNDREDIFLADRQAGTTTRVSVGPGGVESARDSGSARVSGDGRYVVFESLADNFVAGDTNGTWDIFLRDVPGGTVQCLSMAGGHTANDESHTPVISRDGSLVVFSSLADDLVPGDTNKVDDLFLWQRGVNGLQLLSRTADGRAANDDSAEPTISDDNRYILFTSQATDLPVADYRADSVIYLYDRQAAALSQVHPPPLAGRQRGGFYAPRLAPDGRHITLLADVTGPDGVYVTGIFLYDRLDGTLIELTRTRDGVAANGPSVGAALSTDGRYAALDSRAANLIGETSAGVDQVLLADLARLQPDEWIRRNLNAPYRGLGLYSDSVQRVEPTAASGSTQVFAITLRNAGTTADRFVFNAPTNAAWTAGARYFLQPAGTDITAAVANGGWTSDLLAPGDTLELRIQVTATGPGVFDQDFLFSAVSVTDPTRTDTVRLRLLRDDDQDGLPDAWEQQYFGSPANATAADDGDGDGLSNLAEYIAGTNPADHGSSLRITRVQPDAGWGVTLSWPSATNRIYTVERALGEPVSFDPLATLFGNPLESSYHDSWPTNPPPIFYRVRAELP